MKYRFRAECESDVLKFVDTIQECKLNQIDESFGEVEVELEIDMDIDDLIGIMKGIEDGHVMYQTLAMADQYTGERDYTK